MTKNLNPSLVKTSPPANGAKTSGKCKNVDGVLAFRLRLCDPARFANLWKRYDLMWRAPYKVVLAMKSRTFELTAFANFLVLSVSAVGNNNRSSGGLVPDHSERSVPVKVVASLWGDQAMTHTVLRRTDFIRRTEATEYQRRIAAQNARDFFSHLTPAKELELRKKNVQSVFIPTARSPQTSPEAKDLRMAYSLKRKSPMNNFVVEFSAPLPVGKISKPEGLDAGYVPEPTT